MPEPGKVMKSGNNTSISNVKESIRCEWLNGGGTVWRQDILKKYPHDEVKSSWAVCEDLIYSYPKSKKYPLYVCQNSKINIEDVSKKLNHFGVCNFQLRVDEGVPKIFEINARHSGTTYIRSMYGFNEIEYILEYVLHNREIDFEIREGIVQRYFDEFFVERQ